MLFAHDDRRMPVLAALSTSLLHRLKGFPIGAAALVRLDDSVHSMLCIDLPLIRFYTLPSATVARYAVTCKVAVQSREEAG